MKINALEMMEARDKRVVTQRNLINKYNLPLISFMLNIPGNEKRNSLFDFIFNQGCFRIEKKFSQLNLIYKKVEFQNTGNIAFFIFNDTALDIKKKCVEIEEEDEISRLYDIDVICNNTFTPISRSQVKREKRNCIICKDVKYLECRYQKKHTIEEVYKKSEELCKKQFAHSLANLAKTALFFELYTSPKPGLVDRNNNGSHSDMDYQLFDKSIKVITPFLEKEFLSAMLIKDKLILFNKMKEIGIRAEKELLRETKGINTHKGAFYSLSIIGCAISYLISSDNCNIKNIKEFSSFFGKWSFKQLNTENSHGQKVRLKYKEGGIFEEAINSFPSVFINCNEFFDSFDFEYEKVMSLSYFDNEQNDEFFFSNESICLNILVKLMSNTRDSNILYRGGIESLTKMNDYFSKLDKLKLNIEELKNILIQKDKDFIKLNLSPGGCADLLSLVLFVLMVKTLKIFI